MIKTEELFDVEIKTLEEILNVSDNKDEILENVSFSKRFSQTKQLLLKVNGRIFKVTKDITLNLEDTLLKIGYAPCSIEQDYHYKPNGVYNVKLKDNTSMKAIWIEKRAKVLYKQEQEQKRYEKQKNSLVHY